MYTYTDIDILRTTTTHKDLLYIHRISFMIVDVCVCLLMCTVNIVCVNIVCVL